MTKYIILKSFEGFADRMQVLLYAIKYSLKTGRILVIDWTDKDWAHNPEYDFYYYFNLKNLNNNYLTLNEFHKEFNNFEIIDTYDIMPYVWIDNLFKSPDRYIYGEKYILKNKNKILKKIIKGVSKDFQHKIVVLSGVKYRRFNYNDFKKHISFTEIVRNNIESHPFYKKIIYKNIDYIVVHLRGGDRMVSEDKNKLFFNGSCNNDEYLLNLKQKLIKAINNHNAANILILSDTTFLINAFINNINDLKIKIYTTDNYKINRVNGLHKLGKDEIPISKRDLNIQMLIDFYFMTNARKIISDNISLFSSLSKKVKLKLE